VGFAAIRVGVVKSLEETPRREGTLLLSRTASAIHTYAISTIIAPVDGFTATFTGVSKSAEDTTKIVETLFSSFCASSVILVE
jgi:hypothetical protein